MAQTLDLCTIDLEQFATPGRAVGSQSDTVQRQPQQRAAPTVFGTDGANVGMVVLYRQGRQVVLLGVGQCCVRAVAVGLQVVRNELRLDVEQGAQALHGFIQKFTAGGVVQIANVR